MTFERFRQAVKAEIFDYQSFTNYFSELKKPRDKIAALIMEGKVIRLKNGLYIFGEDWRKTSLDLEVLANLIYGPSCISFEYALTSYGLLAERSHVITSLAIGDSKTFQTKVGLFEYRAVDSEKYKVGIEYRHLEQGGYFIASKEKALADFVYRTPGIRTIDQLNYYLFVEMRIDKSEFRKFDQVKMKEIALAYNKHSVNMLSQL